MEEKIREAAEFLKKEIPMDIDMIIVLGSGLNNLGEDAEVIKEIDYRDIPHFPISTVAGHSGKLLVGKFGDVNVLMMRGRFHYYEGYSMQEVTLPMRVFHKLGIKKLLLTNAAGAVNTGYVPGDLVLVADHINLSQINPLVGKNLDDFGPRFPDMSEVYDKEIREKVKQIAESQGLILREGVYGYVTGPTYETPAEIRAYRNLGVDVVGMSTVPEAIIAKHQGMRIACISLATNMAAGILERALNHEEVIETASIAEQKMRALVKEVIVEVGKM